MLTKTPELTEHGKDSQGHLRTIRQTANYSVEKLPNGLTLVFCRASKLIACFNSDGTYRHGDLGVQRGISEEGSFDYLTLDETLCRLDEKAGRKRESMASRSNL